MLKWLPIAPAGVVVLGWALTFFGSCAVIQPCGDGQITISAGFSTVGFAYGEADASEPPVWHWLPRSQLRGMTFLGTFSTFTEKPVGAGWLYACNLPLLLLLALLLPITFGPFVDWRFRLWQWFAYTLLLAALFTYYTYYLR
jgi:hypothetical protein